MRSILITALFPLWALLGSLLAWWAPGAFIPLKALIIPLLGMVMFGMGMTLTGSDFLNVLRRPFPVFLGVTLQFLLMPFAAWALARGAGLAPQLAVGLILVGCSPGGTASNVICYLARGDVALSITLTTVSTLLAVVATPLLTLIYAGETVPVPALDILITVFKIIFLPVMLGVMVNHFFHRALSPVQPGVSAAIGFVDRIDYYDYRRPESRQSRQCRQRRGHRRRPAQCDRTAGWLLAAMLAGAGQARMPNIGDRGGHAKLRPRSSIGRAVFLGNRRPPRRPVQYLAQPVRFAAGRYLETSTAGRFRAQWLLTGSIITR